jgi:hypothetical protein
MKRTTRASTKPRLAFVSLALASLLLASSCEGVTIGTGLNAASSKVTDHRRSSDSGLSSSRVAKAKASLVVAYWHTSHGSQLVTGNVGMDAFYGGSGLYVIGGDSGLRLHEEGTDLGNPGLSQFEASARAYLAANPTTNVVMASWCGQVSGASESMISDYLDRMTRLETDFPKVVFVYMTGHSDGSGPTGNLRERNDQIRGYCTSNGKWLYDFNDIESYDPDGTYYGDKSLTDNCDYDSNGDGEADANWATAWQKAHPGEWWDCDSAHSQPLNANMKARAAWQLWCSIAETL